jgi:hypothetical protein
MIKIVLLQILIQSLCRHENWCEIIVPTIGLAKRVGASKLSTSVIGSPLSCYRKKTHVCTRGKHPRKPRKVSVSAASRHHEIARSDYINCVVSPFLYLSPRPWEGFDAFAYLSACVCTSELPVYATDYGLGIRKRLPRYITAAWPVIGAHRPFASYGLVSRSPGIDALCRISPGFYPVLSCGHLN